MFKNLSNLTHLAGMFKNMGQIRTKIAEAKERLAAEKVTSDTIGGGVRVEMNGLCEATQITIEPHLLSPEMQSQLQESLREAFNQSVMQAKQLNMASVKQMTAGIDLPGVDGILEELAK